MGRKDNKPLNLIELFLFNNVVPILVTFVGIVVFTIRLEGRVDLINQKVDFLIKGQEQLLESKRDIEIRYGELSLKVKELETRLNTR